MKKLADAVQILCSGEIRCLKRIDLVKALASDLPLDTIQFGKHVISIQEDPITSYPVLHLQDGSVVRPKIVIGCDGVNSIISTILGPYSTKLSPTSVVRGFSYVRNGHDYGSTYHVFSNVKHVKIGIFPVTSELIYWFVTRRWTSEDSKISRDRMLIKESTVELLKNFPQEIVELIEYSDLESLHLTDLRYRSPWEVLMTNFRKGTMTVAGDAMHAMCPFLAQAGSASLEDAVVLARCLGEKLQSKAMADTRVKEMVEKGIDEYLNKRKMRVFWLCLQTDLVGRVIQPSSLPMKLLSAFFLTILFSDPNQHTRYDCCES
uniref:FAD-binding domain-containing protein n=1 Tax=Manihot esculenta TaxID=3983 RepID=A0A2C9UV36_MANES